MNSKLLLSITLIFCSFNEIQTSGKLTPSQKLLKIANSFNIPTTPEIPDIKYTVCSLLRKGAKPREETTLEINTKISDNHMDTRIINLDPLRAALLGAEIATGDMTVMPSIIASTINKDGAKISLKVLEAILEWEQSQ